MKNNLFSKGVVGYAILAFGVGWAVHGNTVAINDSKERGQIVRGIICSILTDFDKQQIKQLPLTSRFLHIPEEQLRPFTEKSLQEKAEYRKKLQPSTPRNACSDNPVKVN